MPVISCRKILTELNSQQKVESIGDLPNPIDPRSVSTNLSLPNNFIKTDTHPVHIKCSALSMRNEKYHEKEWPRVPKTEEPEQLLGCPDICFPITCQQGGQM